MKDELTCFARLRSAASYGHDVREVPLVLFLTCTLILGLLLPAIAPMHAENPSHARTSESSAGCALPPSTPRHEVVETLHGVKISDPYRWLEDQHSPETRGWIDAENRYTESILGALPGRDRLEQQISTLMKVDTVMTPHEEGGRYFFSKRGADQELFVVYVRNGLGGKDEVLLDPHPLSPDHSTSIGLADLSPDGKLAVYQVRRGGEDETTIKLLDVDSRKDLPDQLPRANYLSVSLKHDKSGLYYSRQLTGGSRVFYHALNTASGKDQEIFGEGYGPEKILSTSISDGGRYLIIHVLYGSSAEKTEVYYQDLVTKGPILPLAKDVAARFIAYAVGDQLFLHTNWKAPNGRILAVDLRNSGQDHWREIVAESGAVIEGLSPAGGKLFVNYTHNASSQLRVFEPDGKPVGEVDLPSLGTVSGLSGRWHSNEAFFEFSSFHVPPAVYHYDVAKRHQEVWARTNVPVESDRFEVKQVWYESNDKTKVPMFLLHLKGLKLDGMRPTLITGYGGFDISVTPTFSQQAVLWAVHGGVFALPSLRGGGEFGENWHRAGMLEKKQNVFGDFIAAAEWLVREGYTNPSKLAIMGRSNGGLLVGAALTQRPDLYRAVICGYPLLDMIRYQRFLVAQYWVPEYGSSEDPGQFKYLYAYSPYHHVKKGTEYPAVLFMTGDFDTRVDPLHARKMAALLQWATAPPASRPVLLHYDTKAGHSGGLPLHKQIANMTDELGFLFWQLKVVE
jgi:prolyl oligopeptidase